MDNLLKVLLIAISIALGLGIIIFFLTCIYHVKDKQCIIVERMEQYHGTYYKGWYWFWPFVYRRVARFDLGIIKTVIRLNNKKKAEIQYQIANPTLFYQKRVGIEQFLTEITLQNDDITFAYLKEKFQEIGIDFINIKSIKEM